MTGLRDRIAFDGDLVMATDRADVADCRHGLSGKIAFDRELKVLGVRRAETGGSLANAEREIPAEAWVRPGDGWNEGELVWREACGASYIQILVRVGKARVGGGSVDCSRRVEAEGGIVEVLKGTLFFGSVVVDSVATGDGKLLAVSGR